MDTAHRINYDRLKGMFLLITHPDGSQTYTVVEVVLPFKGVGDLVVYTLWRATRAPGTTYWVREHTTMSIKLRGVRFTNEPNDERLRGTSLRDTFTFMKPGHPDCIKQELILVPQHA